MNSYEANKIAKTNPVLLGIDRVVDFATLGEYRVVTGSAPKVVENRDIWAVDIEWDTPVVSPLRQRPACSLPRARDRRLARALVHG